MTALVVMNRPAVDSLRPVRPKGANGKGPPYDIMKESA